VCIPLEEAAGKGVIVVSRAYVGWIASLSTVAVAS